MCAAHASATPASYRARPSTTSTCESVSAPPPPYFSGNATPRKPSSPSFSTTWRGKVSSLSHLAEYGLISCSANSASVSRIWRCSSLSSKSIGSLFAFLLARMNVTVHPLHDVLGRRAGREDLLDAHLL